MQRPDPDTFFAALDATWPALRIVRHADWTLRQGGGGGKRVSAATRTAVGADIAAAEGAMRGFAQSPLFMIRDGDETLDAALDAMGYRLIDPVVVFAGDAEALARHDPRGLASIRCETPLAIQADLWAEDGIGPARLAVMDRVTGPKAWLLGRSKDRPAATAFVAAHGPVAMLHALVVTAQMRRSGLGTALTGAAATWARENGAPLLTLMCLRDNVAASALYRGLGMEVMARYHYRILDE